MKETRVMVCVTGQKTCERLIAEGHRLAIEREEELSVLHVAKKGAGLMGSPSEAEALEYLFEVSSGKGADMTVIRSDEVVKTIEKHARKIGASLIVLGCPRQGSRDLTADMRAHMPDMEFHIVYTD
ncbi:MAG: universal stress protein [Clostridia bacterium]|nr:universal stress protein [Clostridia bacterium]